MQPARFMCGSMHAGFGCIYFMQLKTIRTCLHAGRGRADCRFRKQMILFLQPVSAFCSDPNTKSGTEGNTRNFRICDSKKSWRTECLSQMAFKDLDKALFFCPGLLVRAVNVPDIDRDVRADRDSRD